jgi:hypothetical protein
MNEREEPIAPPSSLSSLSSRSSSHGSQDGPDLQQPHERRLVLLLKRDHVEHAETLVVAGDDLLARLDHLARR